MTWFMFWMWIACSAISAILQKAPSGFKDSGDWSKPSAEEGKHVPIVLGTCRLRGPNCLYFGDVMAKAMKQKTGGFLGIGAKTVKTGCKYYCGAVFGLSTTIDAVIDIIVGDKSFAAAGVVFPWSYSALGTTKTIALDGLFGGKKSEGGISGKLSFYFGSDSQTGNAYYAAKRGKAAPGFRGMCYAVLEKMYIGTQKYMKEWNFVVRHCPVPSGMDSAKANINGDANPSHGTVYLMTTPKSKGGMGISISRLDIAAFNAAATTLYNEGFGISLLIDNAQSADTWLATIRQTIDAAIYTDPVTGLWTIKLIRADYSVNDLTEFVDADCVVTPKMSRPSWSDTINKVIVRYNSRTNGFTIRTVADRDPGNRAVQGIDRVQTMDFPAVSNLANARVVVARERKQLSYPVAAFDLTLKRKAWSLRPGSAFLLTNSLLGITKMPCRVINIKYGALEVGEIQVEATEDIFGISTTAYSSSTSSAWSSPVAQPLPVAFQTMVEVPYGIVGAERNVFAMGTRGDTVTEDIDLWVNEGSGYLEANTFDPAPSGTLQADWSAKTAAKDTVGFTVAGVDLDYLVEASTNADGCARGVNLALVGNEWISWTTCTDNGDNTYTITGNLRGIFDSVPEDHAAGTRVWFLTEGCSLTQISSTGSGAGSAGTDGADGIDGIDGVDGLSVVWTGEYSDTHPYAINEACALDGSSFISLQDDNTGNTPDPSGVTDYWDILALKGDDGTGGSGGSGSSGSLIKLAEVKLTVDQASVNFSNISQSYKNLRIMYLTRGTVAAYGTDMKLVVNGDTGANYRRTYQFVHGSVDAGYANDLNVGFISGASNPTGGASIGFIEIPFYADTTFFKNVRADDVSCLENYPGNTEILRVGGQWRSMAAVTSLTLSPVSGNFLAGSTFILYGEGAAPGSSGVLLQDIIQMGSTGTTTTTVTDRAPTISQGMQIATITITPTAIGSKLVVRAKVSGQLNARYNGQHAALFKDGVSANIAYSKVNMLTADWPVEHNLLYVMTTTSLTDVVFALRAGSATAGTFTAFADSWLEVQELDVNARSGIVKVSAIPAMTSNTAPAGVASASSAYSTNAAWHAFQEDAEGWVTNGGSVPGWIQYQFASAKVITSYGIRPWSNDSWPARWLTGWHLDGSNNGTDWTVLDTRTHLLRSWIPFRMETFSFVNTTAYTHYRLTITGNGGDAYVGLQKLELYES